MGLETVVLKRIEEVNPAIAADEWERRQADAVDA
jgi:hypothetical protein